LLEDVDGWEGSLACGLILQPTAGQAGLERALQIGQRLKGFNESRDHGRTPPCDSAEVHRTVLDPLARLRGNGFGFDLGTVKSGLPKIFMPIIKKNQGYLGRHCAAAEEPFRPARDEGAVTP
jgi:hypothetical protein